MQSKVTQRFAEKLRGSQRNLLVSLTLLISILISSCSGRDPKLQQYIVEGEQLYIRHCSNCHQRSGKGLGLVYPPIDVSDYLDQHPHDVVCMMKEGRRGELVVNGKTYNQPMPGVVSLTELEIAEIMSYLNNNWGRGKGIYTIQEVSKALTDCRDRK